MSAELQIPDTANKIEAFKLVAEYLSTLSLRAASVDSARPWGGFFVIDKSQTPEFIATYFPDYPQEQIEKGGKLSPKILVVEPGEQLSWQYHNRREELWRILTGPVGICIGTTDTVPPPKEVEVGETVQFGTFIRHRLMGLNEWGVVAEIWQHTIAENPSDEDDIVRVSDAYGR